MYSVHTINESSENTVKLMQMPKVLKIGFVAESFFVCFKYNSWHHEVPILWWILFISNENKTQHFETVWKN